MTDKQHDDERTRMITLRIPQWLHDRIRRAARERDQSMNQYLRELCEREIR